MNRRIVYTAQIPLSADFLQAQKNALQSMGQLVQDVMVGSGTKALLSGLTCMPTTPASMTVDLGPGSIYQRGPIDGAAFGSLPADTEAVLQQGISTATQNFGGFAAPTTNGQSINYLVQVQFRQVDSRPLTLPYYNAANPQVPLIGPNGDGSPQSTDRSGTVAVQVLAGAAAATGSQTLPRPPMAGSLPTSSPWPSGRRRWEPATSPSIPRHRSWPASRADTTWACRARHQRSIWPPRSRASFPVALA